MGKKQDAARQQRAGDNQSGKLYELSEEDLLEAFRSADKRTRQVVGAVLKGHFEAAVKIMAEIHKPTPKRKPLPLKAPAPPYRGKWRDGEAVDFIRTHYAEWLDGVSLTRGDIRRFDKKLAARLDGWLSQINPETGKKNTLPADVPLPTDWERNRRLDFHGHTTLTMSVREYNQTMRAASRARAKLKNDPSLY